MNRTILVLLISLIFCSCTTNENTLEAWGRSGKVTPLINFIKTNHVDYRQLDLVKVAITQIVINDHYPGIQYLRKNITKFGRADLTIHAVNLRNPRRDSRTFLHNYIIDWIGGKQSSIPSYKILIDAANLDPSVKQRLKDFIDDYANAKSRTANLEMKMNKLAQDSSQSVLDLSISRRKLDKLEVDLENSEDIQRQAVKLRGYIIKKLLANSYEIQIPGERYHAILKTTKTTFESSGSFTMWAMQDGTIPMEVKGGFTQQWKYFVEEGGIFMNKLADLRKAVPDLREDISKQQERLTGFAKPLRKSRSEYINSLKRKSAIGDALLTIFES